MAGANVGLRPDQRRTIIPMPTDDDSSVLDDEAMYQELLKENHKLKTENESLRRELDNERGEKNALLNENQMLNQDCFQMCKELYLRS